MSQDILITFAHLKKPKTSSKAGAIWKLFERFYNRPGKSSILKSSSGLVRAKVTMVLSDVPVLTPSTSTEEVKFNGDNLQFEEEIAMLDGTIRW